MWKYRFMDLAHHVAKWSKDPSTQVGAVIADNLRRVVSLGYNGFPRGVNDTPERYNDRSQKYVRVVHAELNAILNARNSVAGCTLFATLLPCSECAKAIIQSGICEVVVYRHQIHDDSIWAKGWDVSLEMLNEAGVTVTYL